MTRPLSFPMLIALVLMACLALSGVMPSGPGGLLVGAAFAQDDDGGDDDGGDDDGGDDGGGDDGGGDDGGAGVGGDDDNGGAAQPGGRKRDTASPGGSRRGTTGQRTRRAAPAANPAPLPVQAAGEIVVTGLTEPDLAALLSEGFTVIEAFSIVQNGPVLHRMQVPAGLSPEAARDRVRARDSGRNADFNHYYRSGQSISPASSAVAGAGSGAEECAHLNCRALTQIGWPALRSPACRATVDIGVIDTGVNLDHPGLSGATVELVRLAGEDLPPSGETHGTAVVALLAGAEARAPGLLPEARIIAVDIFSRKDGDERADVAHLVQALDLLAQRGVRVANLSLAGPPNTVLTDMLTAVDQAGMLVVAAAGNAGPAAPPAWPAAADTVLAVTAVDAGDRVYRRAQRGPHLDVAAPGVDVWSAASVKGVKPRTGTSFAAPFATATAALLFSRDPAMTPAGAVAALRGLARDVGADGVDEVFGAGVLTLDSPCAGRPE